MINETKEEDGLGRPPFSMSKKSFARAARMAERSEAKQL